MSSRTYLINRAHAATCDNKENEFCVEKERLTRQGTIKMHGGYLYG